MTLKSDRQAKILELIERQPIDKQDELLELLRASGFCVTQATVSRDIRELHLIKASWGGGRYRYVSSFKNDRQGKTQDRFELMFRESVVNIDYAGNIVLVKCFTGMSNAVCELFDSMVWNNVVGTLAGDDTFIVLVRDEAAASALCKKLRGLNKPR